MNLVRRDFSCRRLDTQQLYAILGRPISRGCSRLLWPASWPAPPGNSPHMDRRPLWNEIPNSAMASAVQANSLWATGESRDSVTGGLCVIFARDIGSLAHRELPSCDTIPTWVPILRLRASFVLLRAFTQP